jgi:hypothetical protein
VRSLLHPMMKRFFEPTIGGLRSPSCVCFINALLGCLSTSYWCCL